MNVTAAEYARLRGRSKAWVSKQIKHGMPASAGGRSGKDYSINPAAAIEWEVTRARQEATPAPGSQRERLAKAQAEKVELENEIKRGNLIWRWQVQESFQAMAADISARLDGLPGRCAGEVVGMDVTDALERLQDECRSIRSGHAEYIEKLAGDGEDAQ